MNRLQEKYQTSVRAELANKFAYKSSMQIPRVEKIVINMGCGDAVANAKVLDDAVESIHVYPHMLRHTFATRCIEAGMSAVVLSKILGHKNIQVTLNTYTDVFDKYRKEEMMKVDEYFSQLHSNCIKIGIKINL